MLIYRNRFYSFSLFAILLVLPFFSCKSNSNKSVSQSSFAIDGSSKTLILLRHAKSSRVDTTLADFDRPLDTSGFTEAEQMGKFLRSKIKSVDLIVASPAKRTRETAAIICRHLGYKMDSVKWDSTIYLCTKEQLIGSIRNTNDKFRTVIYIGHNPSMTNTANALQADTNITEVKTCGAIAINFGETAWTETGKAKGKLIFYKKPD